MRMIPRMSRHALVAGLAATALVVAGAVATAVDAVPAHAASCSAGYVGLTFDDGPSNAHTPALLNALKQNGLKATLFNEGQFAVAFPAQVQAEVAAGMWIGNHTYDHPHLTTLSSGADRLGDRPDSDGHRQRGRRHAEAVPSALR